MIVNKFSELLEKKGTTIRTMSEATGLSIPALTDIKYKRTTKVSFKTITGICDYFDCKIQDLFSYVKK